jgi:hypothetical protein
MKRSIVAALAVAGALVFAPSAQAQDKAAPEKAAPKEHSMTGCLKKGTEADTYLLTDVEGQGPKSVGIVSSTAKLAPHVGHKMELTGTAVDAKEAEADKKTPKAPHYMKVSAAKMVAATCP